MSVLFAIGKLTPPKETDTAVARFFPVIVTGVPMGPCSGLTEVTEGIGFSGSLQVESPTTRHSNASRVKQNFKIFILMNINYQIIHDQVYRA
jgi:fatty acid desaturase